MELRPGCILGRSRPPPALPGGYSQDPLRLDLGMTTANAKHVSRHECTVEEVTSTSVTLFIPDKLYLNSSLYKPLILRKENATSTNTRTNAISFSSSLSISLEGATPIPSQRFTLYVGDVLIFQTGHGFENHPFQVVPMTTTTTMPVATRKRSAALPRVVVSNSTNKPTPSRSNNHDKEPTTKNEKKTKKKTKTTHPVLLPKMQWLPVGATPFTCPFETKTRQVPSSPLLQLSPTTTTTPSSKNESSLQSPPQQGDKKEKDRTIASILPAVSVSPATTNGAQVDSNHSVHETETEKEGNNDDDDCYSGSDDDDDADAKDPKTTPRDMHTTLGNTLQKALCESTTPTMGATLLNLTTLHHHRLPSLQLCQALIHQSNLLDCGTRDGKEGVNIGAQRFILEYFHDAADTFPTLLPQRLATAAGPTAWRTILELCSCLPSPPVLAPLSKQPRQPLSSSKSSRRGTPSATTTSPSEDTKKKDQEETSRRHRRHHHHRECLLYYGMLEQHLLALQFLFLVLDGTAHTTGRSSSSSNSNTAGTTTSASPSNDTPRDYSPRRRRSRRTNNTSHHINSSNSNNKGKQPSSQLFSSSSSSSTLLLEDMREFGGAAACRLAASTMAHVLCVLGPDHLLHSQQQQQHLPEEEDVDNDDEESTQIVVFHSVASNIMEYLGWMLRFMVQELLLFPSASRTTDDPMKATNVATLLWNALSSRLDDTSFSGSSSFTRGKKAFTLIEKRNLKIYWLECFQGGKQEEGKEGNEEDNAGDDDSHDSQQRHHLQSPNRRGMMIDLEEILAAKLKITKEYFENEK